MNNKFTFNTLIRVIGMLTNFNIVKNRYRRGKKPQICLSPHNDYIWATKLSIPEIFFFTFQVFWLDDNLSLLQYIFLK